MKLAFFFLFFCFFFFFFEEPHVLFTWHLTIVGTAKSPKQRYVNEIYETQKNLKESETPTNKEKQCDIHTERSHSLQKPCYKKCMALPFTLHTKLSISTTSVRLFHVPIISPRASHKPFEVNASTLNLRGLSLSLVSDKRLSHCCSVSSSRTRVSMATKGEVKKEVFESAEDLAVALAKYTAQLSDKFCKERGAFSVVLSGGSLINSLR